MTKHPLNVTRDYASSWGVVDGVREIFQNCLDQEIVDTTNTMFFSYNPDTELMKIGNLKSKLELSSLLFGKSTKRNNKNTIGKHGDGLKVGSLALVREGKKLVFYNYGKRQVWTPRFVKSRIYGEDVLNFFVEDKGLWSPIPHNNLEIEIEGITESEYEELKEKNLHLKHPIRTIITERGRILMDEDKKNKIYVNGLFVEEVKGFKYGYDIMPAFIDLDRDRRSVEGFSLKQITRNMWSEVSKDYPEEIVDMAKNGSNDIELLHSYQFKGEDMAFEDFTEKYGINAIPTTSSDYESDKLKYPKAELVSVNPSYKSLIMASDSYNSMVTEIEVEIKDMSDELVDLIESIEESHNIKLSTFDKCRVETLVSRVKRVQCYE